MRAMGLAMALDRVAKLERKVRSLQRRVRLSREELDLTFTLVLPKRGTVTHRGMRRTLELLGHKFKDGVKW